MNIDVPFEVGAKLYTLNLGGKIIEQTVDKIYIEVSTTHTTIIEFGIASRPGNRFKLSVIGDWIFLNKKDIVNKVISNL
jgi:hypothetical protein